MSQVVQTTEFIAALAGVVGGFFFNILSDVARALVRRKMKNREIKKEVGMIKNDALSAVRIYIENDKIERGSKKSPLLYYSLDPEVIADKDMLLEAGVSISQRKALKSIRGYGEAIDKECERLNEMVLNYKIKMQWENINTTLCHYFAYIVFCCDEYLGDISLSLEESLNGDQFHDRNKLVISEIERKYNVKIPSYQ